MAGEYLNDEVLDGGLDYATTNGTKIDVLDAAVATFAAIAGATLGNKTTLVTGSAEDGTGSGRKVVVPAITDGTVSGTGLASHWALSDGASILVACGPLSNTENVTSGNTFTLDAIEIEIPDVNVT